MITPGQLETPLIIYMGATFNPTITWNNGVIGNPINLTGYTADMKIRPWLGSNEIIAELSTGNGGIAINTPTNGTASLLITAAASSELSPCNAVFDLQLTGGGETDYLLQGAIQIQQMVTR
jgi:hypothetical protein